MLSAWSLSAQFIERDRIPSYEEYQLDLEKRLDSVFLHSSFIFTSRPSGLTEEDFVRVATELDVEVAVLKAIVEIETGKTYKGIVAPGIPLVNYSSSRFINNLKKRGINIRNARANHPLAFSAKSADHEQNYEKLKEAMAVDSIAALSSTYWGMFQIGGFNYKLTGCSTPTEFVRKMEQSEQSQLELLAVFLEKCNMVEPIRQKNWQRFARLYNGPGYYKRGYHKKLAAAYKKYK